MQHAALVVHFHCFFNGPWVGYPLCAVLWSWDYEGLSIPGLLRCRWRISTFFYLCMHSCLYSDCPSCHIIYHAMFFCGFYRYFDSQFTCAFRAIPCLVSFISHIALTPLDGCRHVQSSSTFKLSTPNQFAIEFIQAHPSPPIRAVLTSIYLCFVRRCWRGRQDNNY